MPVVEFALDPAAQHRIQLHIPTEQAHITVMLNNSILGSLTPEEQVAGKNFRLPDNSPLHVRIFEGQPQVSRAGYLLPVITWWTCEGLPFLPQNALEGRFIVSYPDLSWIVCPAHMLLFSNSACLRSAMES